MTDSSTERPVPGLANAQVTGGGGHVPDLDQNGPADDPARVPAAGSGVDLKTSLLDEDDG